MLPASVAACVRPSSSPLLVVAAWIAWLAWPLTALYGLARAVEARDAPPSCEQLDVGRGPPLPDRSDSSAPTSRLTGASALPQRPDCVLIAGPSSIRWWPLSSRPKAFAPMLHDGWVDHELAERPPDAHGLSARALGDAWQVFLNSGAGFDRYSVSFPADKPTAQRFELRLRLRGLAVAARRDVILPQQLVDRLARASPRSQPPAAEPSARLHQPRGVARHQVDFEVHDGRRAWPRRAS